MCYLSFVKRLIPDIEVGDYVSFTDSPGYGIGVAVADTPYGPYKDAIGEPLITGDWNDIDPTVYVDDDGQAYLFYGQTLKYCLLNDDMISLKTQPAKFNVPNYVEGPWFTKHNGKYYFMWAANGGAVSSEHKGGENLQYAYCDEPLGNYTYGGILQETTMGNSFTNHPGVCDFQGRSYLFYHVNVLPAGGYNSYHRSVCVSEMFYNDDGTIELVPMPDSVDPIDTFNPYNKTEAETIAWETGVKTGWDNGTPICNGESVYVYNMHDTDYIQLRNVDFGNEGAVSFTASVRDAKNDAGASIEIYVDDELVGTVEVDNYSDQWKEISTKLTKTVTGVHDLRFEFKGAYEKPENETGEPNNPDALVSAEDTGMFKFDYWKFDTQSMLPTPTPVVTAAPVATAVPNDQNAQATPSPAPVAKVKVAKVKGLKIKKSGNKATVSWQKASGAKKYEVYYGTNKNFKKATKKIVVKNKVVIKKLKKGKTYYFKVRGFANGDKGKKVYGSFSAKKKIRL